MHPEARDTGLRWRAAAFLALVLSAPAAAQDDELARVREDAKALRQALDRLDARIQALERAEPAARQGAPRAAPDSLRSLEALASLKRSWQQVVPGLLEVEVEALLGKPQNVLNIDNALAWYYVYPGIGRGSVFFNANRKVSGRQAPAIGW